MTATVKERGREREEFDLGVLSKSYWRGSRAQVRSLMVEATLERGERVSEIGEKGEESG